MAVTFAKANMTIVENSFGNSLATFHAREVTGSTWVKGDLLQYSGGFAAIAAAADTPELLLGIAHAAASTVVSTDVAYTPFLPGTIIEATLLTGSSADFVYLTTDPLERFGYVGATGAWYIDHAETTAADTLVRILDTTYFWTTTGQWRKGAVGDTNVRVLAMIINSAFINLA